MNWEGIATIGGWAIALVTISYYIIKYFVKLEAKIKDYDELLKRVHRLELDNASNTAFLQIIGGAIKIKIPASLNQRKKK